MKRVDALRHLSVEHHHTLVIAKRLQRIADFGDAGRVAEGCAELVREFETSIDGHFRNEEATLLPMLAAIGERELVERTIREHEEMRSLMAVLACHPNRESLLAFTEAIAAHVRFEERTLFETAQAKMSAGDLAAMATGNRGSS